MQIDQSNASPDMADALLVHAYSRAMAEQQGGQIVGPFAIRFSRNPSPFNNYAIPLDFADPSSDDIAALINAFERRRRLPRLEFVPAAAPLVEPALLAAGFVVELRPPLMTRRPPSDIQTLQPEGFHLVFAKDDHALRDYTIVQHEAFDEPIVPGEISVAAHVRSLARGGCFVVAYHTPTGEPAGAGSYMPPQTGVTEIVGIAVAPRFRRQGLAQTITTVLASKAFGAGCSMAFLSAAGEAQSEIYARAGFIRRMPMAYMAAPERSPQAR
jgi:ribosomal protein S18 acetylase RimI-like enzyme